MNNRTRGTFIRYLCDAHRVVQDYADTYGIAQTVFYHPDHGFTCAPFGAAILRDKRTEQHVTWLPSNYFEGPSS